MPSRIKSVCTWPGCNTLTINGRCEKHPYRDHRPNAGMRGYDSAWRRLRNAYIRQHPICEMQHECDGDPADEVDHIIPIADGGERLDEDNLQSLCKACHTHKTHNIDLPARNGSDR